MDRILEESELASPRILEKLPTEAIMSIMNHMDGKTFFRFRGASKIINSIFLSPDGKSENIDLVVRTLSLWLKRFLTHHEVWAGYDEWDILRVPPYTRDNLPLEYVYGVYDKMEYRRAIMDTRYDNHDWQSSTVIRDTTKDLNEWLSSYTSGVDMNNSEEIYRVFDNLLRVKVFGSMRVAISRSIIANNAPKIIGEDVEAVRLMVALDWTAKSERFMIDKIVNLAAVGRVDTAEKLMKLTILKSHVALYPRLVIHDVANLRLRRTPWEVLMILVQYGNQTVYDISFPASVHGKELYDNISRVKIDYEGFPQFYPKDVWKVERSALIHLIDFMYWWVYKGDDVRREHTRSGWPVASKSLVLLFSLHTRKGGFDPLIARDAFNDINRAIINSEPLMLGEMLFIMNSRWLTIVEFGLDMIMWSVNRDDLILLRNVITASVLETADNMHNLLYDKLVALYNSGNLPQLPPGQFHKHPKDPSVEARKLVATHPFFTR